MVTKKEQIDWLRHIKDQKIKEIQGWQIRSSRQNICDFFGENPIDKLQFEIKIINNLIGIVNGVYG